MAEHSSEWAVDLANKLHAEVWAPRMADFVAKVIQHCAGDATPLTKEQEEQLWRAGFEAGDGVTMDTAFAIDQDQARRLIESAVPSDRSLNWWPDPRAFPHDPEPS